MPGKKAASSGKQSGKQSGKKGSEKSSAKSGAKSGKSKKDDAKGSGKKRATPNDTLILFYGGDVLKQVRIGAKLIKGVHSKDRITELIRTEYAGMYGDKLTGTFVKCEDGDSAFATFVKNNKDQLVTGTTYLYNLSINDAQSSAKSAAGIEKCFTFKLSPTEKAEKAEKAEKSSKGKSAATSGDEDEAEGSGEGSDDDEGGEEEESGGEDGDGEDAEDDEPKRKKGGKK